MTDPTNRQVFVVTIDAAKHRRHVSSVIQDLLTVELKKKKHCLGEVVVYVRRSDHVAEAALNFASAIEQSGRDAVNERIH